MKLHTRIFTTLGVIVSLFLVGCTGADTHEKLADEMVTQLERMTTAIGSISDKASAEKAMADLKSVVEEIKKIGERAKKLGDPTAEVKKKLEERMEAKSKEIQKKMTGAMISMMKAGPEVAAIVGKGMQEFGTAMQEAGKSLGAK